MEHSVIKNKKQKISDNNLALTIADKGNFIVILPLENYFKKIYDL